MPEQVVGAGREVPVAEAGHVRNQHVARHVAARDQEARRDPRLAAGPAGDRGWIQQMLAHRDGGLVEIRHAGHRGCAEMLLHRDDVLDRPFDVAAVARGAVEVLGREDGRQQRLQCPRRQRLKLLDPLLRSEQRRERSRPLHR